VTESVPGGFVASVRAAAERNRSLVCVGLDPEPERLPAELRGRADAILEFNRRIVDATAPFACCFKPQFAHYAAVGAEEQLHETIRYIHDRHPGVPVILDSKRGDIGSTAERYAREAFERYGADAVTVNPWLGGDSLAPYLAYEDRGVIVLCRTSNPGARDLQDLLVDGRPLYLHVAERVARDWNGAGNCLLVVGATWPRELAQIRGVVGDVPFLVPGIGAQGGDVEAVLRAGLRADGHGLLLSSSRAILYASTGADFAEAAGAAARALRDEINRHRP
jgi:orotidine-5'-phosphate decarboxylase